MGPRGGLDGCKISRPHRDSIPGPSSKWRVAIPTELSLSTDTRTTCHYIRVPLSFVIISKDMDAFAHLDTNLKILSFWKMSSSIRNHYLTPVPRLTLRIT